MPTSLVSADTEYMPYVGEQIRILSSCRQQSVQQTAKSLAINGQQMILTYRRNARDADEHVDRLVASHTHKDLLLFYSTVLSNLLLQIPLVGAGIPLEHI